MTAQPPSFTAEQNESHNVQEASEYDRSSSHSPAPVPTSGAKMLVGAVLLVLITAGVVTFLNRKSDTDALAKETEAVSIPTVAVVQPQAEAGNDELVLPGNLQAFEESPIFARTNGYLLRWYKDIGSKIQKGELLAAIDTPEVDQELSQAKASRRASATRTISGREVAGERRRESTLSLYSMKTLPANRRYVNTA